MKKTWFKMLCINKQNIFIFFKNIKLKNKRVFEPNAKTTETQYLYCIHLKNISF